MADDRDHAESFAANQQLWEAWTAAHAEGEPGSDRFVLPPGPGELPLTFSLRATKPAAR